MPLEVKNEIKRAKWNMIIRQKIDNFALKIIQSAMKTVFIGLLTVLMICSCSEKKESGVKAPTRVKTEVAGATAAANRQQYVGIVEEREARVLVSEGQAVSRGQLLAEMDDTQARNLLSGAEAAMAQANDALERYAMLHDAGSLPEVQWVEIQSKVAQAKSQLAVAKKNLADCRLVAPVSGIIGRKYVGAGETAMPSQAVVTILDISSVKVKASIPETEIGSISANTSSIIRVEATGQSFEGGRIEKGVQADALTHTYDIRINVANAGRQLLPGMVASVQFNASSSPSQGGNVLIPVTSIQKKTDGSLFVWTVGNDSTAHRTTVTIGETTGNRVAVITGLESGQRIVTEGYQKLSEGSRIVY